MRDIGDKSRPIDLNGTGDKETLGACTIRIGEMERPRVQVVDTTGAGDTGRPDDAVAVPLGLLRFELHCLQATDRPGATVRTGDLLCGRGAKELPYSRVTGIGVDIVQELCCGDASQELSATGSGCNLGAAGAAVSPPDCFSLL
mmetsp:Transcript_13688/g.30331  ORF Transcript_13688/g.30331 Transcript_13688/m.30331 type:complete len:144 (+) Transcript_13688:282-713(+)|eukprot:CAMPEP_0204279974 /NCGR_PEP_ID=MMETSP0468-20130131/36831_1 /ASSEMBLY_ACC=CAM_ASM_000383 /TAXON_ID=2969 /ORGANISM="Oxyrrhis marina" /LENGTH=143 /DNA_ID=CAMNT_0051257133 /DNA_START=223 /DNA_END=654 /DNA_ORIENTATION=+